MKDSPWGPNPEWASPNQAAPTSRKGDEPSCMSVFAPVGVVIGTLLAWVLRRC